MNTQAADTGHTVTLQLWHSCLSGVPRCSGRSQLQLPLVEALPWPEPSVLPKEKLQEDSVVRHERQLFAGLGLYSCVFEQSRAHPLKCGKQGEKKCLLAMLRLQ